MLGFSVLQSNTVSSSASVVHMLTGSNLVGMEFVTYDLYDPASGPPADFYPIYSDTLLNWLHSEGVRQVRFPLSWEALQQTLGGPIPAAGANYVAYFNAYTGTINRLLSLGISVVVVPWQYNAATGGTDICYQGAAFTKSDFKSFWSALASAINTATSNDQRVSFAIMNEPHHGTVTAPNTISEWTPYAQYAIDGIRGTGATNRIWYQGWDYDDCGTFVSNGSAAQFLTLTDSKNNLGVEVHNYNGQLTTTGNNSSTTALRDAMSSVLAWSQAHNNIPILVGEAAIDLGQPNGSLSVAQNQWADWQAFCVANKTNIAGWCWWAVSEDAWWPTSDSSGDFNWGLTDGCDSCPSSYMNLIQTSLGSF